MASLWAVAVAALLQMVLRISFFIEQSSDACSTAPTLASWIFLIAFLDVLLDTCVYPVRYMHLPYIFQITTETIVTVFLTEFGTLAVWCRIEKITCKLCKSMLLLMGMSTDFYRSWQNYILGGATTSVSLVMLLFVAQATDHVYFTRKKSFRLYRKIKSKSLEVWKKLHAAITTKRSTNSAAVAHCNEDYTIDLGTEIYNARSRTNKPRPRRAKASRSRSRKRR